MPDHHDGLVGLAASSSSASAATLASMVHGAAHDDRAVADQVGCGDRDVGQVPRRQRLPAPAVPGQAVDGQHLRRAGRAVAVHVQQVGSRR